MLRCVAGALSVCWLVGWLGCFCVCVCVWLCVVVVEVSGFGNCHWHLVVVVAVVVFLVVNCSTVVAEWSSLVFALHPQA